MPPEDDPREESEEAYYADHPDNPLNRALDVLLPANGDKRMACPTCDHTMGRISDIRSDTGCAIFSCPRCGTVSITNGPTYVPMLVMRCRGFEKNMLEDSVPHRFADVWHRVGIGESINKPEDRPK